VHARHQQVQHDQVGAPLADLVEALGPVVREADVVAVLEQHDHELAHVVVVVHHDHFPHPAASVAACPRAVKPIPITTTAAERIATMTP
jgi:hypothetical protein